MVPNPGLSGQSKLDLVGYIQKQDTKLEGMGGIWEKLREEWGKQDQNTSYETLKE